VDRNASDWAKPVTILSSDYTGIKWDLWGAILVLLLRHRIRLMPWSTLSGGEIRFIGLALSPLKLLYCIHSARIIVEKAGYFSCRDWEKQMGTIKSF
jgi:hypothetical protein